jgi:phage head maturation protease
MEAMPRAIHGGKKGWEFIKEEVEIPQVKKLANGSRVLSSRKSWTYKTYSKEAAGALRAIIKGYKVLWDAAKKDEDMFHELIKQFNKGKLVVPYAEESNYETLGLVGKFEETVETGSMFDKYDFGSYTFDE